MIACFACGRRVAGVGWMIEGLRLAFCSQGCVEAYERTSSLERARWSQANARRGNHDAAINAVTAIRRPDGSIEIVRRGAA